MRLHAAQRGNPSQQQQGGGGAGGGGGAEQQLTVCEYCAAYLSVNESAQRLADHFNGKMHIGFQKIREKLKEMQESRAQKSRSQQQQTAYSTSSPHTNSYASYGYSSYGYDDSSR